LVFFFFVFVVLFRLWALAAWLLAAGLLALGEGEGRNSTN